MKKVVFGCTLMLVSAIIFSGWMIAANHFYVIAFYDIEDWIIGIFSLDLFIIGLTVSLIELRKDNQKSKSEQIQS